MAASPRNKKPAAATAAAPAITLQNVIDATKSDAGFLFTPASFHAALVQSGDVEINSEMTDEHGNIATRATAKHLAQNQTQPKENTVTDTAQTTAAAKPSFVIESGLAIPERTRAASGLRSGRAAVYPFDQLEINQSFFVADKDGKPAAKSLASTVAGANQRHSEVIEGQTRTNRKGVTVPATRQLRQFKVFQTTRDGSPDGEKGARVFRVAVE